MPYQFDVTLAVNSYKSASLLRLTLRRLLEEVGQSGLRCQVLLADSATDEDTTMLMHEEFPTVEFYPHTTNVGFKHLVNTSIQKAQGKYLYLLNADILLSVGSLRAIYDAAEANPDYGLLAPRQLGFSGEDQKSAFRFYKIWTILARRTVLKYTRWGRQHLEWFTYGDRDLSHDAAVEWVMGSALFTLTANARTVGGMDDAFFMYMEDVDWCRRYWEHQLPVVYIPSVTVHHYHAQGSKSGSALWSLLFNRLTWYHLHSAYIYFRKYWGKANPYYSLKTLRAN
jgi:N-acetylglucosaminyl-diphospho-decaprenol L-rhamnosyltransferase